jgi:hypothetical protein
MTEVALFGAFLYGMGILTGCLLGSALVYRKMVRAAVKQG